MREKVPRTVGVLNARTLDILHQISLLLIHQKKKKKKKEKKTSTVKGRVLFGLHVAGGKVGVRDHKVGIFLEAGTAAKSNVRQDYQYFFAKHSPKVTGRFTCR